MKKKEFWIKSSIIFVILIVFDQITKYFAYINLRNQFSFPIIKDVFELQYLENQSAAFGKDPVSLLNQLCHFWPDNSAELLRAKMLFLSVLTVIVLIILVIFVRKIPDTKRFTWLNYTLVVFSAGAFGNLIDRVVHNYVIDFFYFKLINFPVFNVADIYVTVAAFLLIILGLFYYKDDDYELIFGSSKKKGKKENE